MSFVFCFFFCEEKDLECNLSWGSLEVKVGSKRCLDPNTLGLDMTFWGHNGDNVHAYWGALGVRLLGCTGCTPSSLHSTHALVVHAPMQGAWARAPYSSPYPWVFFFFFNFSPLFNDLFGFILGNFLGQFYLDPSPSIYIYIFKNLRLFIYFRLSVLDRVRLGSSNIHTHPTFYLWILLEPNQVLKISIDPGCMDMHLIYIDSFYLKDDKKE
jgi:hypothetical protein